jgi:hypothetical protein
VPLFFLPLEPEPGPSNSYGCHVPDGTAIYVYLSVGGCSSVEPEPYFVGNEEELQACIDIGDFDLVARTATEVNGREVANLDSYRPTTPMFTVNVPEDGVFDEFPPAGCRTRDDRQLRVHHRSVSAIRSPTQ